MALKKILYYAKPFVMKIIFTTLAILFSMARLWAQEPVVFHFNFSFQPDYKNGWINFALTNDLEYISINIYDSGKKPLWKKQFINTDFVKDQYGNCLLVDTIKSLVSSKDLYSINVKYQLVNKKDESSDFSFSYNDTVENLALEIFFDQSKVISTDYEWISFEKFYYDLYAIDENPKPVLVVKYLKGGEVSLIPTWFTEYRINPRPRYYLFNGSTSIIKSSGKGIDNYFSGHLQILDSINIYKNCFLGFECGTVGGKNKLFAGETDDIVEGFTIGDPQKLNEGFYKYSVGYLENGGERKNAETYFRVIYSK